MPAKKSRSRKRDPLSREAIVDAAFAVIKNEGLPELSIRKIAAQLKCEAMSIYHYFPSKAHLLDALVDRVMAEMSPPPSDLAFREALRHCLYEIRKIGHRYPDFFPYLAVHRLNTPAALAWLDRILAMFRDSGLADRDAAQLFRVAGYYAMGATLDEAVGYSRGPSAAEPMPDAELVRRFPNVAAAGPYFQKQHWDRTFELGLDFIIDGILSAIKSSFPRGKP